MATITSVVLNGLEICSSSEYALHRSTLTSLLAATPREAVLIDMQARHPEFQRSQVMPRPISIIVMLLRKQFTQREDDYEDLVTAAGDGALVNLVYTKGASVKTYSVHCSGPVPDPSLHRVTIEAVAPDPVAT